MYKGLKPVLWCTQDQTALAEAEVEYDDHTSPSIYVKFHAGNASGGAREIFPEGCAFSQIRSRESLLLSGRRPPGLLPANQAVCIHPDIDYVFVQDGSEAMIMAASLADKVMKECGYTYLE